MNQQEKTPLLQIFRAALILAVPIALQNLLTSCGSLVDAIMIVPLGNAATAAVGVSGRFTFLLNVVAFGFCSGSATLISQYWGANDRGGIHHTYGVAASFSLVFSLLFAAVLRFFPHFCVGLFGPDPAVTEQAVEYVEILAFGIPFLMFSQVTCAALRAVEKVNVPLISSFVSVAVTTFFNFCLIGGHFGFPALGIRGAAIATALGAVVQAIIVLLFFLFSKNPVRCSPGEMFRLPKGFLLKFFKTAAPVLLNEGMWALGTNIYVMVLARQATEDYAGYTIYETAQQLVFVFFVGICNASAILVGKAVGRGDEETARRLGKIFLIATPCSAVLIGLLFVALRNPLLSLFVIETEGARQTASNLLLLYGLWLGAHMIPYTSICGTFRAGGDTKTGCIFELCSLYLVGIPAVCLSGLVFHLPFVAIIAVQLAAEDIPKTALCLIHFKRGKWIRCLTNDAVE